MKHIIFFLLLGFSFPTMAQTENDSARLNTRYEYLTIIADEEFSDCNVFISKDSTIYEKKTFNKVERFNLTEVVKILSKYNKEGWLVQNSNMVLIVGDYPTRASFYYLLYRKKR